jgi:hypothetical protein
MAGRGASCKERNVSMNAIVMALGTERWIHETRSDVRWRHGMSNSPRPSLMALPAIGLGIVRLRLQSVAMPSLVAMRG